MSSPTLVLSSILLLAAPRFVAVWLIFHSITFACAFIFSFSPAIFNSSWSSKAVMVGVATSGLVYGLGGVAGLISVGRLTLDDTDDGSGGFALSHPWSVTYGIAQAIGRYGVFSAILYLQVHLLGRVRRSSSTASIKMILKITLVVVFLSLIIVAFTLCIIDCLRSNHSSLKSSIAIFVLAVLQILATVLIPFILKRTTPTRSARSPNSRASFISHKASSFSLRSYLSSVVSTAPGDVPPVWGAENDQDNEGGSVDKSASRLVGQTWRWLAAAQMLEVVASSVGLVRALYKGSDMVVNSLDVARAVFEVFWIVCVMQLLYYIFHTNTNSTRHPTLARTSSSANHHPHTLPSTAPSSSGRPVIRHPHLNLNLYNPPPRRPSNVIIGERPLSNGIDSGSDTIPPTPTMLSPIGLSQSATVSEEFLATTTKDPFCGPELGSVVIPRGGGSSSATGSERRLGRKRKLVQVDKAGRDGDEREVAAADAGPASSGIGFLPPPPPAKPILVGTTKPRTKKRGRGSSEPLLGGGGAGADGVAEMGEPSNAVVVLESPQKKQHRQPSVQRQNSFNKPSGSGNNGAAARTSIASGARNSITSLGKRMSAGAGLRGSSGRGGPGDTSETMVSRPSTKPPRPPRPTLNTSRSKGSSSDQVPLAAVQPATDAERPERMSFMAALALPPTTTATAGSSDVTSAVDQAPRLNIGGVGGTAAFTFPYSSTTTMRSSSATPSRSTSRRSASSSQQPPTTTTNANDKTFLGVIVANALGMAGSRPPYHQRELSPLKPLDAAAVVGEVEYLDIPPGERLSLGTRSGSETPTQTATNTNAALTPRQSMAFSNSPQVDDDEAAHGEDDVAMEADVEVQAMSGITKEMQGRDDRLVLVSTSSPLRDSAVEQERAEGALLPAHVFKAIPLSSNVSSSEFADDRHLQISSPNLLNPNNTHAFPSSSTQDTSSSNDDSKKPRQTATSSDAVEPSTPIRPTNTTMHFGTVDTITSDMIISPFPPTPEQVRAAREHFQHPSSFSIVPLPASVRQSRPIPIPISAVGGPSAKAVGEIAAGGLGAGGHVRLSSTYSADSAHTRSSHDAGSESSHQQDRQQEPPSPHHIRQHQRGYQAHDSPSAIAVQPRRPPHLEHSGSAPIRRMTLDLFRRRPVGPSDDQHNSATGQGSGGGAVEPDVPLVRERVLTLRSRFSSDSSAASNHCAGSDFSVGPRQEMRRGREMRVNPRVVN